MDTKAASEGLAVGREDFNKAGSIRGVIFCNVKLCEGNTPWLPLEVGGVC